MLLVLIINSLTFSDANFKTSFFAYVLRKHCPKPIVFMGEVDTSCIVNECLYLLHFYALGRGCVKMGFNILERAFGRLFC